MLRWLFLSSVFLAGIFGVNVKSFFTYTFDASKDYDIQKAKKLYFSNKCHTCHGEVGEKSAVDFRALKDMKPEEIKAALISHGLKGGVTNMAFHSNKLSHNEIDELIAYLKGKNFAIELQAKDLLEKEPSQKTQHGTFIK